MSIVDKLTFEETDLSKSLLETKCIAALVAQIIGDEPAASILTAPGDELADLLMTIRRGITGSPEEIQRAVTTIDEAIELCFLHSEAYTAAFELFKLEKSGELVSDTTARSIINEAIEQVEIHSEVSASKSEQSKIESFEQHEDHKERQKGQN